MSDSTQDPAAFPPFADPIGDILAKFVAKYPDSDVTLHKCSLGQFIARTPDEGTFSKFMVDNAEQRQKVQAAVALCKASLCYPEPLVLSGWFSRKPGLALRIADVLIEKAGALETIEAGK